MTQKSHWGTHTADKYVHQSNKINPQKSVPLLHTYCKGTEKEIKNKNYL